MKYFAFRLAQILARSTPRQVAYGVGRLISWFHYRFDGQSRRAVMSNLAQIHRAGGRTLCDRELKRQAREVFLNFAKYVVDFFSLFHLSDEQRRKLIDLAGFPELLKQSLGRGKGTITVTAHMGNWELGGAAMCMCGFKVNAVALVQADAKLNELFQSQRLARGMQVVPMGRAARPCLEALQRNEIVAVLGDRDFTAARVTVDFLGKPARLPHGPSRLAFATGATLIPAFMIRKPDDTFAFVYGEPIHPEGLSVEILSKRIAKALGEFVEQYPTQWFLFNDFWDIEEDRAVAHSALAPAGQPSELHQSGQAR